MHPCIYEALNHLKIKNISEDISILLWFQQSKNAESVDVSAIDETAADRMIVENESFESMNDPQ